MKVKVSVNSHILIQFSIEMINSKRKEHSMDFSL